MSNLAYEILATTSIITILLAMLNQKVRQLTFVAISNILFIFIRRTYVYESLGEALKIYLYKEGFKSYKPTGSLMGEGCVYIKSDGERKHVLYKDTRSNGELFYGKGGWPFIISGKPLTHHKDLVHNYSYVVYSFRWDKRIMELVDAATELKNEKEEGGEVINNFCVKRVSGGRFIVEKQRSEEAGKPNLEPKDQALEAELGHPFSPLVPLHYERDDIGEIIKYNTMEMMSLTPELEDLKDEIMFWANNKDWYEGRGMLWKRGILLHGKPGVGKSMFSRACAESLNWPIVIFDLASMNNAEFLNAWSQILPQRVILFEDIDAVFHKRENIVDNGKEGGVGFDVFLNALDGVDRKSGILTLITTNFPDKLDIALAGYDKDSKNLLPTRPSRIDRVLEMLPLDYEGRIKLAERILRDKDLAKKVVDDSTKEESAAQLQERCFRASIEILFKKRKMEKETERRSKFTTDGVEIVKTIQS